MNYQPLFNLMSKEHGLTLVESEMDEIILTVNKMMADSFAIKEMTNSEILERLQTNKISCNHPHQYTESTMGGGTLCTKCNKTIKQYA